MNTGERHPALNGQRLDELPEYDLRYLFDDGEQPNSVTVYAPESLETTWITVDAEAAVSLDDLR